MSQEILNIFISALSTVVLGLAAWATTAFTRWLGSKMKDQKMSRILSDLFTIIMNAVQTVFQEYVDTLKKAGKFDEAAQKEAKERAYKIIVSQLTPELKQYITDNCGDIKDYLMNQIEAMIYQLKK